ncbi:MAG: Mur ligase domain-containing protein [Patescibacteria group bacterium]
MSMAEVKNIHFIGIGGIGMSALARLAKFEKISVSGSDVVDSDLLAALEAEGMTIFREQGAENIDPNVDLFVYTEAMSQHHPELLAARATGKRVVNYFEALGEFVNPYYLIAVAGTHGKTTTTAMLTDVFEAAEQDPTAIIGSLRASTKKNFRPGKSKYAIVEACEYKRDFLTLTPDVLVILNIEHEHVDFYRSTEEVIQAFKELVAKVHETGVVIANLQDKNVVAAVAEAQVPVIDYNELLDLQLPMQQPGLHTRMNAAAALAVAKHEKLSLEVARKALSSFAGTWRRFEYKAEVNGAPVYDDYGHHPTEIAATLAGAKELHPDKELTVVFQPHTYSRTKELFNDFAKSFKGADHVVFVPIYAAREELDPDVSSRELAVRTIEYCTDSQYADSLETAEVMLRERIGPHDVVLVMGAGDVTALATKLVS